jgi:hypothetical protein
MAVAKSPVWLELFHTFYVRQFKWFAQLRGKTAYAENNGREGPQRGQMSSQAILI